MKIALLLSLALVSANIPSEYPQSEWVNGLSILLETGCEAASCSTEITFLSQKLEDEAGNASFEFNANAQGVVYDKPVKSAPDNQKETHSHDPKRDL